METNTVPLSEALAYSPKEAARVSGLGLTTVYRLINDGILERRKVGTRSLSPARSLRALIEGEAA